MGIIHFASEKVQKGIDRRRRTANDRNIGPVLGQQTGSVSTGRENKESSSILLECCCNGGHSHGFWRLSWANLDIANFVEERLIRNCALSEYTGLRHHKHCIYLVFYSVAAIFCSLTGLDWVTTLSRLTGQHDAVCAIKHRVGNIGNLCTGWTRVILRKALIFGRGHRS